VLQYIRKPCRVLIATILASSLFLGVAPSRKACAAGSVEKLQDFGLDQVQITDTYQQNLFTQDINHLIKTLDSDRLMNGFKAVSAGTSATNLYGGWESQNIRGHSMGHWLVTFRHFE